MSLEEEIEGLRKEMDECDKCGGDRMVMHRSGYIWCSLCVMTVRKLNIANAKLELSDMGATDQLKVIRAARESVDQARFMLECTKDDLCHIQNLVLKADGHYPDDIEVTEHHKCKKSPIGMCIYDQFDDPCHDQCLACGKAEDPLSQRGVVAVRRENDERN